MFKIQRSMNGKLVVFALSGRIKAERLAELQKLLASEADDHGITLDLKEVRLVDRDVVRFLGSCEAKRIKLANCPAYIREWIERESTPSNLRANSRHQTRPRLVFSSLSISNQIVTSKTLLFAPTPNDHRAMISLHCPLTPDTYHIVSFPNVIVTGHQAFFIREALGNDFGNNSSEHLGFRRGRPLVNEINVPL